MFERGLVIALPPHPNPLPWGERGPDCGPLMTLLSVNVNKVATLRNTRALEIPSPARAARLCLDAGAHGITVHPRPDRRHIRPDDVYEIAALLRADPRAEFNIE